MTSIREQLDRAKSRTAQGFQRKKGISGKGAGKWQTLGTLGRYRRRRNRARKMAAASRRRNRA